MSSDASNPRTSAAHRPRLVQPVSHAGAAWEEILSSVAAGDEVAFERLYDESNPLIFGLVLRIVRDRSDAEEITFDVYSQVWAQAARFDRARSSAAGWLVMIARSRALDHLRSGFFNRRRENVNIDAIAPPASKGPRPDDSVVLGERRSAVNAALAGLADEQRTLLELAFFEGLSHSELASKSGVPLGTVKTRIRSALSKLRASLAGIRESG